MDINKLRREADKGNPEMQYKLGKLYSNGTSVQQDYSEAVKWTKKAAEQGHVFAQYNLGIYYSSGEGVERDVKEAMRWFKKAAEKRDVDAQFILGMSFIKDEEVEQDYEEAAKWFRKAAEQGHIDAQYFLGALYVDGKGVSQDHHEAVKWYQKAAEQGDASAQFRLGKLCLFDGWIARNEENVKKGWEWLDKAVEQDNEDAKIMVEKFRKEAIKEAEAGDVSAQHVLGYGYFKGHGFPKDIKKAIKWLKLAAAQGNKDSQYDLALTYKSEKNYTNMMIWANKLAEQGDSGGEELLGNAYENGLGVPIDYSQAVYWYRRAAEKGTPNGQFNLGCLYRAGKGVPKSEQEAASWFLKAADQGDVDAQMNLSGMYFVGEGVEKNYEEGKRWLTKAAEHGDETAINNIKKLEEAEKSGVEIGVLRTETGCEFYLEDDIKPQIEIPLTGSKEEILSDPYNELYQDGLNEKDAGNFDKAIGIWKKILEKDFRHLNAINGVACAYAETGKLDMAKKYIDMAMKVGGDQADFVRSNLAGILYDTGKFKEAEEILNAIGCKDGRMIDNLTRVLVARGKSERALELIEEFLAKEDASTTPDNDEVRSLQEIVTRGVDCILECKLTGAIDFLEKYAHILPPEPLSSVYFNAGIHFLQEENDGVRALICLSEAVKNNPDDSEMREALSDAALKVIAEFGGQERIPENDKAVLATAYETVGNRQRALEIKKQITPSVKNGDEERPPLSLVTTERKPSRKTATEDEVDEKISKESGGLDSFWNDVALKVGERTGLHLITSIEKNKAMNQIMFRRGSVKGVYFVFSLRAIDWVVRIDIDFGSGKDQANREFFDKLELEAPAIEKAFGQRLTWEKGKGRTCKIICPSDEGGYKTPESWTSVQDAMVDAMVRLEKALNPFIYKLSK